MKLTKFWFVWNPAGLPPRHQHGSKESAMAEAKRLATSNAGQQFIVLKAVGGFVAPARTPQDIRFVSAHTDDIPF